MAQVKYVYPYQGFEIRITPGMTAPHCGVLSWSYLITNPGEEREISKGDGYATQEEAETAAEERIESWD